jgi:two-component system response regulator NreC
MKKKIIIVDDHEIVRDGIAALILQRPDMELSGMADNGQRACELALETSPDIVVMDLSMPVMNGIEATRKILEELPACKIIILSMHSDKRFVTEALKAGASAYLLKESASKELWKAIEVVGEEQTYLSPALTHLLLDDYRQQFVEENKDKAAQITTREREVLQLIAEGQSTKEIANSLFISSKTVETHRRHLMEKLEVNSLAGLVKYAIRMGLTDA